MPFSRTVAFVLSPSATVDTPQAAKSVVVAEKAEFTTELDL